MAMREGDGDVDAVRKMFLDGFEQVVLPHIRSQVALPSSSLSRSMGRGVFFRAVRTSLMIPSHNTSAIVFSRF
jgi:hypothetical protein